MEKLPSGDLSFWNDTLWCLFDAKCKKEVRLSEYAYDWCTFILSTPPRRDLVNDFKKAPWLKTLYMPIWTQDELGAIAHCFPEATDWRRRFRFLGGVPRLVLENTSEDPVAIIDEACAAAPLKIAPGKSACTLQ